ncbi:MAG: pre-16S rRNA-processing nuclease YqgF, partial [Candidatus Nanopelagicaceae bacterium]|nr:pre-16S rRNA-processing nuclease YqgF [Candidatus Nanopelagicaceae bacterium]
MSFGRRLGIDYGQVRVGLAICDNEGLVATPLTTLKNDKSLFNNLENIIAENNVVGIFLGKPKHLSGVEGA